MMAFLIVEYETFDSIAPIEEAETGFHTQRPRKIGSDMFDIE
jgi:hypothetical protein